jgi:hypothetical protein
MLESTLEILQQFYIRMEIEPDDFHLFPGDSSLYTLRCVRCRKPVTVAGSIGEETAKHTLCGIVLFKLNTFFVMFLYVPSIDSTCIPHT